MSKAKAKAPEGIMITGELPSETYTGKAFMIVKDSYVLSRGIELEIVNGLVVGKTVLGSPDMPATTIGSITAAVWRQLRGQ
jgi:hypothetical protein